MAGMENSNETDGPERELTRLMARVAMDDEDALNSLYDLTSGKVYGISLKILGKQELAEEATLEVFTKLWRTAATYQSAKGRMQVWLNTLTRNTALDVLRRENRRNRWVDPDAVLEAETAPTQEDAVRRAQQGAVIGAAMARLSPIQKQIVEAAYFGGMSHGQIADSFQIPLGSVKTHIRSGMEKLRQYVGRYQGAV